MPGGALRAARSLIREPTNINSDNLKAFLAFLLGGLVIICLVALLMARIVSRPSLSQTLPLNED